VSDDAIWMRNNIKRTINMNRKPNIVLIMTDQQRGDCLSIRGHKHLMTPVLDNLAAEGILFTRAYSESPTCVPSRRCVMTGQSPYTNGVVGFALGERIHTADTLPEIFRRAGYQTASIGRGMHQSPGHARYGFETINENPFDDPYSEFNHIWKISGRGKNFNVWPHVSGSGIGANSFIARPWMHEERFHETNWSVTKAVEFLDKRDKDVPFFLYLGFVAPHPPLTPPQYYFDKYMNMQLDEPHVGDWADNNAPIAGGGAHPEAASVKLSGRFNQQCRAGYYGQINHVDDQLRIFLERVGYEKEDTYILFTADHGEMLGDHNCFRKSLPYEGSAHIPMILNGPSLPKGKQISEATCLMDIFPTFCELADIKAPEAVEGTSLLRFVEDNPIHREYIHGEHSCDTGHHYITDGKRKFVWFTASGCEHFFDLEKDPNEMHDCIDDTYYEKEVTIWRKRLINHLKTRVEGFSDGENLIPGRDYPIVVKR
jgi:arylsulfatase